MVTRKALERALEKYGENPMLLFNHLYSQPAGLVTKALVDDQGLWIEATLPRPEGGQARHYWDLVKRGVMRALSIGGTWKRELVNGVYALTDIDLREISIASVGVNAGTLLSAQTAKAFGDAGDRPDALTALARLELRQLGLQARELRERAEAIAALSALF